MGDVEIRREGRAGRITLNRPDALNALTHDMTLAIERALVEWETDPDVALVMIDAAGDKAFCAGGDIQQLYARGQAGDYEFGRRFWRDEYRLNARIHNYIKPYVAFMHGIVMGGGAGISIHGSYRIVTERSLVAWPECGIGLVPDVGATYYLTRAPGNLGVFLSLTGYRMNAADAIYAGFADIFVPYEAFAELKAALVESGNVDDIARFAQRPEPAPLLEIAEVVDTVFRLDSLGDIAMALEETDAPWAATALKVMRAASPLSLAVALNMVRTDPAPATVEDALRLEYRFTHRSQSDGDFTEGVRALIVDKDRTPKWRISDIAHLDMGTVRKMTAPLGAKDLRLEPAA